MLQTEELTGNIHLLGRSRMHRGSRKGNTLLRGKAAKMLKQQWVRPL
jgi:hypothetical protein